MACVRVPFLSHKLNKMANHLMISLNAWYKARARKAGPKADHQKLE